MANLQARLDKLKSIKWDLSCAFTLSQLVEIFPLPQIVRIFYANSNDETLGKNTILCLHSVIPEIQTVHGHLSRERGGEVFIPLDCRTKLEVRRSNLKDVYESVEELCSVFPEYVRVSKGYFCEKTKNILLNFGDKLQLKGIDKSIRKKEKLVCFNQHGKKVQLPKNCVAGFQPLEDGKEYFITDLLHRYKMPFNAQFVVSEGANVREDERPPCQPFQSIYLDGIANETVIMATILDADGKHDRMISPRTNIGVVVCEETFRDSSEHASILQLFSRETERPGKKDSPQPDTQSHPESDSMYEDIDKYSKPQTENSEISTSSAPKQTTVYEIPVEGLPENMERPTGLGSPQSSEAASELPKKALPEFTYYTTMDAKYIVDEDYQPPAVLPAKNIASPVEHRVSVSSSQPESPEKSSDLPEKTVVECPDVTYYTTMNSPCVVDEDYQPPHVEQRNSENTRVKATQAKIPDEEVLVKKEIASATQSVALSDRDTEDEGSLYIPPDPKSPKPNTQPECPNSLPVPPRPPPDPTLSPSDPPLSPPDPPLLPSNPPLSPPVPPRPPPDPTLSPSDPPLSPPDLPLSPSDPPLSPPVPPCSPPALTPEQERELIYQELAKYPLDLSALDLTAVGRLLKSLGMEKYVETFKEEMIDGEILAHLDKESLQSLSFSPFHIKKLLKFIGGWRPNN